MTIPKVAVVGFEIGIISGFDNAKSAHIQYIYNLVQSLQRSGVYTQIITNKLRKNTYIPSNLLLNPPKIIPDPRVRNDSFVHVSGHSKKINFFDALRSIMSITSIIFEEKYTHVHFANGGLGVGFYACVCNFLTLFRCSVSWSPTSLPSKKSLKWTIMSYMLNQLKHIVVSTEYQASLLKALNLSPLVIKHGSTRNFRLDNVSTKKRVTFWRDPSYSNGADIALSSFLELSKEFPEIIFTLMFRPHYDPIVIPNALPKNVEIHYYPYPSEISLEHVLSETLLCVFPFRSLSTNPQLSVLESICAEIPCIVTNIESLPEYVLDKQLIILENSPHILSSKIRDFILTKVNFRPTHPSLNGYTWKNFSERYVSTFTH